MKISLPCILVSACAAAVHAAPLAESSPLLPRADLPSQQWDHGSVDEYPIHKSCNATEQTMLRRGLQDAVTLASHARDHALRFGNDSGIYRKYFGNAPSNGVIGNLARIVSANKANTLFRCDDPDGKCQLPDYGGHWRGTNATGETVICPLSYSTRLYLEYFCTRGYTVAHSERNTFFGLDLIHRLYHMPAIGEDHVGHFADSYADVMELAAHNATFATRDSNALQYFAAETYAFDIAVPGVGCSGDESEETPSLTTPAQPATSTVDAPKECHTHDGGEVHCS
ncbi:hypothetical protein AJ79_05876 [Helicocarpus griseus UAMH5409]|uniref:Putative peptidase domain-containing protein n=1 Tax=Helicocarpus griseus UAMH5409 TaxID=1447875 RepID=A0A2B7XJH5_9EURO|nr:hypothetical protein AJ79_05876 [Helicocarpus griseus UAMH5409]